MSALEPGQVEVLDGGRYRQRCAVCKVVETIVVPPRLGFAPPLFGLCGGHGGKYPPVDMGAPMHMGPEERKRQGF